MRKSKHTFVINKWYFEFILCCVRGRGGTVSPRNMWSAFIKQWFATDTFVVSSIFPDDLFHLHCAPVLAITLLSVFHESSLKCFSMVSVGVTQPNCANKVGRETRADTKAEEKLWFEEISQLLIKMGSGITLNQSKTSLLASEFF